MKSFNSSHLVPHICVNSSHLVPHGAKPSPEPMLDYCQLNSWEQVSVKCESEFYHFHLRKCIWTCCLPKWQPFCPGWDELMLLKEMVKQFKLDIWPVKIINVTISCYWSLLMQKPVSKACFHHFDLLFNGTFISDETSKLLLIIQYPYWL